MLLCHRAHAQSEAALMSNWSCFGFFFKGNTAEVPGINVTNLYTEVAKTQSYGLSDVDLEFVCVVVKLQIIRCGPRNLFSPNANLHFSLSASVSA